LPDQYIGSLNNALIFPVTVITDHIIHYLRVFTLRPTLRPLKGHTQVLTIEPFSGEVFIAL